MAPEPGPVPSAQQQLRLGAMRIRQDFFDKLSALYYADGKCLPRVSPCLKRQKARHKRQTAKRAQNLSRSD